jgi:uncharacterized protein YraI
MSSNTTFSRRRLLTTAAGGAIVAATGVTAFSPAASARSTDRMQVSVSGLRLRTGPGTGYSTITTLAKGTIVQTLEWVGKANGYDWVKVKVESTGRDGSDTSLPSTSRHSPIPRDPRSRSRPDRSGSAPRLVSAAQCSDRYPRVRVGMSPRKCR